MRQLSSLDASFWYFETARSPMNIGGLYIFQARQNDQAYTYENLVEHVRSRLHVAKVFTERLVEVPLDLDLPYWVEDPDFDIELHCQHLRLIEPYDQSALMNMAAEIFSKPLDRSRPLWELSFIEGIDKLEGYDKGSFAIVTKVHHSAIDGVSGEEILAALLDVSPEAREQPSTNPPPSKSRKVDEIPSGRSLMLKSFGPSMSSPLKLAKLVRNTSRLMWTSFYKRLQELETSPPLYFSAPKTIFDQKVSPHRIYAGTQLSLATIKKIKNAIPGLTVNDVVLAVCAGALRKYLDEKDELPFDSLVAMVPVSTHTDTQDGEKQNSVSAMLVSLATDLEKPLDRLKRIHQSEHKAKEYNRDIAIETLIEDVPPVLQAFLGRLYSKSDISTNMQSIFNLVVTNIPGPQIPLYFDGFELSEQYGMAPVADGIGLILVVMSYNGSVGIGVTACREIMPDADRFAQYLDFALYELEAVIDKEVDKLAKANAKAKAKTKAKAKPKTKKKLEISDKTKTTSKQKAKKEKTDSGAKASVSKKKKESAKKTTAKTQPKKLEVS